MPLTKPKTELQVKKMPVGELRTEYINLSTEYNRLLDMDYLLCPSCGEFYPSETGFYKDTRMHSGRFPICKDCLIKMSNQIHELNDEPNPTKESIKKVLFLMNKVYIDHIFQKACEQYKSSGKKSTSLFQIYMSKIQAAHKDKSWVDSDFGGTNRAYDPLDSADDEEIYIKETIHSAKQRFGSGYTNEEYLFLENEYTDWTDRYECNTKAQELVFENLSIIKLLKKKCMLNGSSTKDLDAQQQNWLETGKLKPKQNTNDSLSDAQTFGTLIQKYEETRPLPEVDPELADVDNIGLYIDAFYRGHACKMFGIKNKFSNIYENVMKKYTVTKPEYNEEEDSEQIFEKIFGSAQDE